MSHRGAGCAGAIVMIGFSCFSARAGDAVVAGYNAQGAWTSVTYYASSSPAGGKDYKPSAAAREAATRDLKRRGGGDVSKVEVISSSDRTGNFVVARGKNATGKETILVGYGKTEEEAEQSARARLTAGGAAIAQTVMYHYHSYGSDVVNP